MATNYTTKTASLKATRADVQKLDAKKMLLNGKNILDYISESGFDSYDTRDPQLKNDELDIWNTEISLSDNGHIEIKPHVHSVTGTESQEGFDFTVTYYCDGISESQLSNLQNAYKIENNEVFDADGNHIMYWQSNGLTEGEYIFVGDGGNFPAYAPNLTSFNSDLSNLTNGDEMFYWATNLESFSGDLSSLTNGNSMFIQCSQLTSFSSNLSSLTDGGWMFYCCSNLTSFNCFDLSSLTDGREMFLGCSFESFNYDLSSLTYSYGMFCNCSELPTFSSNLSSLTDGGSMFSYCENLTSFTSNLSSLTNGRGMFNGCKLDAYSVANIIHTLPQRDTKPDNTYGEGCIDIGIGCDNTEADQLLFAQECDCDTWQELLDEFDAKNWTVEFQCNGRPTTTYNMRRGETLPIYAKLVEVIMPTDEKEHKPHYQYTSADGSKFYNINYFHSTNGSTEGYDVFSSLEEAISTYNVTPKN